MNILEIAPRKYKSGTRTSGLPISYRWHQRADTGTNSLAIRFKLETLKAARFVEGDRVDFDVSDDCKTLTISISPKGAYMISGGTKTQGNPKTRTVQMKYIGIEVLKDFFPEGESHSGFNIREIISGKIICDMPISKMNPSA